MFQKRMRAVGNFNILYWIYNMALASQKVAKRRILYNLVYRKTIFAENINWYKQPMANRMSQLKFTEKNIGCVDPISLYLMGNCPSGLEYSSSLKKQSSPSLEAIKVTEEKRAMLIYFLLAIHQINNIAKSPLVIFGVYV